MAEAGQEDIVQELRLPRAHVRFAEVAGSDGEQQAERLHVALLHPCSPSLCCHRSMVPWGYCLHFGSPEAKHKGSRVPVTYWPPGASRQQGCWLRRVV